MLPNYSVRNMVTHETGNVYSGHKTDVKNITGNEHCG